MKVTIDETKCNGAGICVMQLPDVFRFQEGSKKGAVTKAEVPARMERKLKEVASQCPAGAILVIAK